jgi:MFS family permease
MSTGQISDRRSRGAGVGAAAYFLLTGILFATWASRVPAIKGGLDLSDGQFAMALLGLEAGAVLGLQLGGVIVPRVGSRRALTTSLVVFTCALLGLYDRTKNYSAAWCGSQCGARVRSRRYRQRRGSPA